MRLLTRGTGVQSLAKELEARGIPVHITLANGGDYLYVCLPQHYADAARILKDPKHAVEEPVDVAEFYAATANTSVAPFARMVLPLILVLLAICAAIYSYFW